MGVCNEPRGFAPNEGKNAVTNRVVCSPCMQPHSMATASGLLLGTLAASLLIGSLVGGMFGSWGIGFLIGAVAGIPLAIGVVYRVYSRAGSSR
jgi:hypothetical protein